MVCGIPHDGHTLPFCPAPILRGRRRGPNRISISPVSSCEARKGWFGLLVGAAILVIPKKKNTPAAPFQHTDTLLPYPLHARKKEKRTLFGSFLSSCEPPPTEARVGRLWSFQNKGPCTSASFFLPFFPFFWVSDNSHQCCKITCCAVSRQPDRVFFHPKSNVIKFKVVSVISRPE